MEYLSYCPGPPLDGFVENLWSLSDAPSHARERILHGAAEVVGNIDVGVPASWVIEAHDHQKVCLRFAHCDAELRHFLRQQRQCLLHLVLHLNLCDVRVGAGRKRRADADIPGGIAA